MEYRPQNAGVDIVVSLFKWMWKLIKQLFYHIKTKS